MIMRQAHSYAFDAIRTGSDRAARKLSLLTVSGFLAVVAFALRVRRERAILMSLDDRMLKDIGLGRSEAFQEGSRSLTDLPQQNPGDRRRSV